LGVIVTPAADNSPVRQVRGALVTVRYREVVEGPDLQEVERELCRIPEVTAARIVADDVGRPTEVHILAGQEKHAKQIARDVQSVAMATFGFDLDRRVISVVQLEGGAGEEQRTGVPPGSRVLIDDVAMEKKGLRNLVRVTLRRGDQEVTGMAEGSIATSARHRLVASATLDALRQLFPAAECADVETATVLRAGQRDVAVASVVFVLPPSEEVVSGSALVRETGEQQAVARAVLDATNRRLPRIG
jgi:hypothetical protein